jgi:hypothetical protein
MLHVCSFDLAGVIFLYYAKISEYSKFPSSSVIQIGMKLVCHAHFQIVSMSYSEDPGITLRAITIVQGVFYKFASTHWWWDEDFILDVDT